MEEINLLEFFQCLRTKIKASITMLKSKIKAQMKNKLRKLKTRLKTENENSKNSKGDNPFFFTFASSKWRRNG